MAVRQDPCGDLAASPPPKKTLRRPKKNPCGDQVREPYHVEVTTWHRFAMCMWCEDELPEDTWEYRVLERTTRGFRCRFSFLHREHAFLFGLMWC